MIDVESMSNIFQCAWYRNQKFSIICDCLYDLKDVLGINYHFTVSKNEFTPLSTQSAINELTVRVEDKIVNDMICNHIASGICLDSHNPYADYGYFVFVSPDGFCLKYHHPQIDNNTCYQLLLSSKPCLRINEFYIRYTGVDYNFNLLLEIGSGTLVRYIRPFNIADYILESIQHA